MGLERSELLEHLAGRELREADKEARERAGALVVLRAEVHARDLAENLVAELGVVELAREDVEAVCHVFRGVLVVLQ